MKINVELNDRHWELWKRTEKEMRPKEPKSSAIKVIVFLFNLLLFAYLAVSVIYFFEPGNHFHLPSALFVAFLMLLVVMFFLSIFYAYISRKKDEEKSNFLVKREVEISNTGITVSNINGTFSFAWSCFSYVKTVNELILVKLRSGFSFILIPESAVETPSELIEFINANLQKP